MAAMAMAPLVEQEGTGCGDIFSREDAGFDPEYGVERREPVPARIRSFPNEDIVFWRKTGIDNSKVERQEDPKIWEMGWKLFSVTSLIVVVVVGLLLPSAFGLIAGFQVQQLQQKNALLKQQQRQLELEESRLLSPARLEELARQMHFVDPAPRDVHHLRDVPGDVAARLGSPSQTR